MAGPGITPMSVCSRLARCRPPCRSSGAWRPVALRLAGTPVCGMPDRKVSRPGSLCKADAAHAAGPYSTSRCTYQTMPTAHDFLRHLAGYHERHRRHAAIRTAVLLRFIPVGVAVIPVAVASLLGRPVVEGEGQLTHRQSPH